MRSLELPFGFPLFPVPDMQATAAGHRPCPRSGNLSLILLPRDLRCKAGAAMSIRDGSSPEAYLCDQVRRGWPDLLRMSGGHEEDTGKTLGKMRGGRKPEV